MTARRRWPSAACGAIQRPSSSGPRQAMVSTMPCNVSRSFLRSRSKSTQPVMPHIGNLLLYVVLDTSKRVADAFRACSLATRGAGVVDHPGEPGEKRWLLVSEDRRKASDARSLAKHTL